VVTLGGLIRHHHRRLAIPSLNNAIRNYARTPIGRHEGHVPCKSSSTIHPLQQGATPMPPRDGLLPDRIAVPL
jgi:hypothetical protein